MIMGGPLTSPNDILKMFIAQTATFTSLVFVWLQNEQSYCFTFWWQ